MIANTPTHPDPGLCQSCQHARRIESDRGSTFLMCKLSFEDSRFVKSASAGFGLQRLSDGDSASAGEGRVIAIALIFASSADQPYNEASARVDRSDCLSDS